ncbi:hypothetical protein K2173_024620 [Erythroxylum novogranatense]|uniref:Uncharacterized protein n=1 Tax=Erythroxylum novogranatense TaxID=1862640 RepID=A0AAV8SV41_9ROSI|nr:hypothetical protein K2173_024620 [Erythroxylum novogranatense]
MAEDTVILSGGSSGGGGGGGMDVNGRLGSMDSMETRWVFQDDEDDEDSAMDDEEEEEHGRNALDSDDEDDNVEQRLIRTGPRVDSFDVEALEIPGAHRNEFYEVLCVFCLPLCFSVSQMEDDSVVRIWISIAFGQSSASPFGSQSPFGQTSNTANNPFAPKPFGSTTPFGLQTGGSIFGSTSTGFITLLFYNCIGQKPVFGGFGSTSQSTPFGTTTQQSQPAFGSNLFGSTSPFGASSQPTFGASSTPGFGSTTTTAFGSSNTPFGVNSNAAFGATSSPAFGATSTPSFGAATTPDFGSTSTSTFGGTCE